MKVKKVLKLSVLAVLFIALAGYVVYAMTSMTKPDPEEICRGVVLVIEDNGCGIKASDLSRVFEKGFTGSNRNKANATGMGLYLSKKLCDRLGLKLDIASTEKEYTRLTITFPKGTVHNFSE